MAFYSECLAYFSRRTLVCIGQTRNVPSKTVLCVVAPARLFFHSWPCIFLRLPFLCTCGLPLSPAYASLSIITQCIAYNLLVFLYPRSCFRLVRQSFDLVCFLGQVTSIVSGACFQFKSILRVFFSIVFDCFSLLESFHFLRPHCGNSSEWPNFTYFDDTFFGCSFEINIRWIFVWQLLTDNLCWVRGLSGQSVQPVKFTSFMCNVILTSIFKWDKIWVKKAIASANKLINA